MLIPKGTEDGIEFVLFAMISNDKPIEIVRRLMWK